jgi:hypothetical protein
LTKVTEGDVWRFPYLWHWQRARGEDAGRKDRPVAVILVVRERDEVTHLILLAITTTAPDKDTAALKVPHSEVRRLGLDLDRGHWLILSEYNHDILQVSSRFDPSGRIGTLSVSFLRTARTAFQASAKAGKAHKVSRIA